MISLSSAILRTYMASMVLPPHQASQTAAILAVHRPADDCGVRTHRCHSRDRSRRYPAPAAVRHLNSEFCYGKTMRQVRWKSFFGSHMIDRSGAVSPKQPSETFVLNWRQTELRTVYQLSVPVEHPTKFPRVPALCGPLLRTEIDNTGLGPSLRSGGRPNIQCAINPSPASTDTVK